MPNGMNKRNDMGFDRSVLNVVEQLNQTVLEPETWPVALASAVTLLRGDHAALYTNQEFCGDNSLWRLCGIERAEY